MADNNNQQQERRLALPGLPSAGLTRRGFLVGAGAAAAAGGALLAACGGDDGDSEGDQAEDDSQAETPQTTASSPVGTIKIGYVTPRTGPLAPFGEADGWTVDKMREMLADGLMIQGSSWAVEIIDRDSESNSNTAATVAQELIVQDGVDLMLVSSTPDTTVPVVQQCTNNETPCLSNNAPWQPHYLGTGGRLGPDFPEPPVASEWNYHYFWGLEDVIGVFLAMWQEIAPGGTVGGLWPDDPDGNAWGHEALGFPPALQAAGFTVVDPGRFPLGGNDFTAQINLFKENGVDIVSGVLPPPDFGNFWAQAQQQGLEPTAVTVGKALLFPGAVASFENPGGISTEIWWSDKHPTSSTLTGQTSDQLARMFEAETGSQWTQPLGYSHSIFEVALDALTRAGGGGDKRALADALGETNLNTMAGPVNWGNSVVPHVTKTPLVGGQWMAGDDWDWELRIRTNEQLPEIPIDGPMVAV